MRKNDEIIKSILDYANEDDNIRAVILNGSLVNSNIKKDIYQDCDVVYVCREIKRYIQDQKLVNNFGTIGIIQEPDFMDNIIYKNKIPADSYSWLVLYDDFNRIDLTVVTKEKFINDNLISDSLTKVLLDKDNIFLLHQTDANESDYYVKRPNEEQLYCICNEFYWCLQNVGKGLGRKQLPYSYTMFECIVKKQLNSLVDIYIGIKYNFEVSVGKFGKYYELYLSNDEYIEYKNCFCNLEINNLWLAVDATVLFFKKLSKNIFDYFDYDYSRVKKEETFIIKYLNWIKENTYANKY